MLIKNQFLFSPNKYMCNQFFKVRPLFRECSDCRHCFQGLGQGAAWCMWIDVLRELCFKILR